MSTDFFRSDDVFLLGNLALTALSRGRGQKAMEMARFVQRLRPDNTTGFMIEAMFLHSTGANEKALQVMEKSDFESATTCVDEARALHLFLLGELGLHDQVRNLGADYLKGHAIRSEAARHTISTVLKNSRISGSDIPTRVTL